jgi:hypothetical protein
MMIVMDEKMFGSRPEEILGLGHVFSMSVIDDMKMTLLPTSCQYEIH